MQAIINNYRKKISLQIYREHVLKHPFPLQWVDWAVWHLYWINGGPLPVARQS